MSDPLPNTATAPAGNHYIPTLDGWRAIAILWVLCFHTWPPQRYHAFLLVSGAFNGVYLFFALSGFLIGSRLLAEEDASGTISLKSFYMRRIFRIQPAALTYLLVISLLGLLHAIRLSASGVLAAALMVRNIFPAASSRPEEWYTSHFWSLAVEEHFYLVFPAFLLLVRRYRLAVLAAAVLAFAVWAEIVAQHPALQGGAMWIGNRTDMVLDYILMGGLVAIAIRNSSVKNTARRWLRPWIMVPLAAFIFITIPSHPSRVNYLLAVSLYSLLVLSTVLHSDVRFSRFLELAPVRFIGRISFSLYLWQQLFFVSFEHPKPGSTHLRSLCGAMAAIVCAVASYYFIERPFIRLGHRLMAQPRLLMKVGRMR